MTIKIQKNSVNLQDLANFLMEQFPQYNFYQIDKQTLKITAGKFIATTVKVTNNKIKIKAALAKNKQYLLLLIFVILLGIIGPLLILYFGFFPKRASFKRKIAKAVHLYYKQTVLNYSNFGRNLEKEKSAQED